MCRGSREALYNLVAYYGDAVIEIPKTLWILAKSFPKRIVYARALIIQPKILRKELVSMLIPPSDYLFNAHPTVIRNERFLDNTPIVQDCLQFYFRILGFRRNQFINAGLIEIVMARLRDRIIYLRHKIFDYTAHVGGNWLSRSMNCNKSDLNISVSVQNFPNFRCFPLYFFIKALKLGS